MQKVTTAVLLSCLLVPISLVPAYAEEAPLVPSPRHFNTNPVPRLHRLSMNPATAQFLSAFAGYAQAVQEQGSQGVKTLATSDFALRQGNQSVQGEKAFKELGTWMDGSSNDGFTVAVHPLSTSVTALIALTRETYRFHSGAMAVAATYYRKQTWRMTPQGWKLAIMEVETEQGAKDFDKAQGPILILTAEAKDNLAEAQEKLGVVK